MHINKGHYIFNEYRCRTAYATDYIIRGWPQNKDDLEPTLDRYWPIRHDLAMIIGIAMKDE